MVLHKIIWRLIEYFKIESIFFIWLICGEGHNLG